LIINRFEEDRIQYKSLNSLTLFSGLEKKCVLLFLGQVFERSGNSGSSDDKKNSAHKSQPDCRTWGTCLIHRSVKNNTEKSFRKGKYQLKQLKPKTPKKNKTIIPKSEEFRQKLKDPSNKKLTKASDMKGKGVRILKSNKKENGSKKNETNEEKIKLNTTKKHVKEGDYMENHAKGQNQKNTGSMEVLKTIQNEIQSGRNESTRKYDWKKKTKKSQDARLDLPRMSIRRKNRRIDRYIIKRVYQLHPYPYIYI